VIAYRDIKDTETMIEAAKTHKHAVVIGGGLLGLEAANGLKLRGMDVTVVHIAPWLMERQLDEVAGKLLQKSLEDRGLKFRIGAQTQAILGNDAGRVRAVQFKDGSEIPADLVVMAAGIRPNTALAESAGIHCNRGIVVSDTLQTVTDPRIYAVGECAAHRGIAYGLVAPLFEQGKVVANHLAQFGIGRYTGSQTSTKLKVTGIDLFSAGNFMGGEGCEDIVLSDPFSGVYKRLVVKGDQLVGACLYGDTVDGAWYFKLLREGRKISDIRDKLMFGESALGDAGHQGQNKAMLMADGDEVCGCNGVCKGTIVKAIKDKGLFTLEDVRKHTKASASCGSCTGLVEQILMFTAGGDFSAAPKKKAMCGCTDASHQEVRDAIREQHLLTIPEVMGKLGWRTPAGCSSCRPALNYYLISTWPHEAKDDPQSRFINERSHANIQKDGTYSVIPRMWGGETSADELRRIADVVDKYAIPTVKVTGGQRIDLLGVKKEDLPAVWRDLGMPSGHAYAKALRTVKTCVGSEWCRFGTQDSTTMGKMLEPQAQRGAGGGGQPALAPGRLRLAARAQRPGAARHLDARAGRAALCDVRALRPRAHRVAAARCRARRARRRAAGAHRSAFRRAGQRRVALRRPRPQRAPRGATGRRGADRRAAVRPGRQRGGARLAARAAAKRGQRQALWPLAAAALDQAAFATAQPRRAGVQLLRRLAKPDRRPAAHAAGR